MAGSKEVYKNNKSGRVAVHLIMNGGSISDACRANDATPPVGYRAVDTLIGGMQYLNKLQNEYIQYKYGGPEEVFREHFDDCAIGLVDAVIRKHKALGPQEIKQEERAEVITKVQTCSDKLLRTLYLMQYNSSRQSPDEWILLDDLEM